jgi:ABC-2 type transport system permease protein
MINNVASALFGFIYIALWQAVAPATSATDPYTRSTMTAMMVLAQVFAWLTTFLPAGLGIQASVRSGAIALEMARPVPFFPMVLARETGNLLYQSVYRALPLALLFAVTVGFPRPASAGHLLLTIPSLALGAYAGLTMTYTVGVTSFWTTEIRWAHWTYYTVVSVVSGGWVPADMLPGWLGRVAPYLPFSVLQFHPLRIYLGLGGWNDLLVQVVWVAVLTLWCIWLTGRALRRIVVQGG